MLTRSCRAVLTVLIALVSVVLGVATAPLAAATTPVSTTTSVSLPTPVGYGAGGLVRATVRDAQGHARSGHVVFAVDNVQFAVPAPDLSGQVSAALPKSARIGRHVVTATYYPTSGTAAVTSQGRAAYDVVPAPSSWRISVPGSVVFGVTVGITATLVATAAVSGAVAFLYNGSSLLDHRGVNPAGTVVLSNRVLWRDRPVVTVVFKGTATVRASSANVRLVIARAPSSASLSAPTTVSAGSSFTVTAAVSGAVTAPTGVAVLLIDGRAGTPFQLSGGRASVTVGALAAGTHTLQLRYGGDFSHIDARSAVHTVTVAAVTSPCAPSARACVDLTHSLVWLQSGGKVVYGPVPMASGRPGFRTDTGMFTVYWKDIDHWSSTYNAPMPYSVFFNGGTAFHEGSPSVPSHACIHLTGDVAQHFFSTLQLGDVVDVFGYAPY